MKNPCLCVFVARYNGGDWFDFFLLSFCREAVHVVHPSWTVRFFRLVLWPLASDEFWDYFHSHERIELLICKSCGVLSCLFQRVQGRSQLNIPPNHPNIESLAGMHLFAQEADRLHHASHHSRNCPR